MIARIKSCAGPSCTNVAIGGENRDRLYITESVTGTVLVADISVLDRHAERSANVQLDHRESRQLDGQQKFGTERRADVSVIGQGTWYIDRGDRKSAVAALRRGIDLGMTHIDTAEMYGDAELVIAEAIAGQARRGFPGLEGAAEQRLAARHHHRLRALAEAAEDRPARLLSAALARLLSAGGNGRRVRGTGRRREKSAPGASAISTPTISTRLLAVAGEGKIACNQVLYHLQERAIEHAVIPWCEQHGVAVVAYSPFGHNDFPSPRSKAGEVLQTIAEAHGATPRQVALAFLTRAAIGVRDSKSLERRSMPRTTPPPASSRSARTRSPRSTRRFRAGRSRAACRCCSGHGS